MALDGSYAGLKASVADWLNRADLAAVVPDFISLAEGQMNRRLRVRRMVATASASISAPYESLPADFAGALALTLTDGRQLDRLASGLSLCLLGGLAALGVATAYYQ